MENKLSFSLGEDQIILIAVAAHEANKRYCESLKDTSQLPWNEAPDWQKESAIAGVNFHIENPDADDAASHESRLAQKEADGWVFGEIKDEEAKTHPCMVAFDKLPPEQQKKDGIFRETVWHNIAIIVETAEKEKLLNDQNDFDVHDGDSEPAADPLQQETDEREAARIEREERNLAKADRYDKKADKLRAQSKARDKIAKKEKQKEAHQKKSDAKAKAGKADAMAQRDALEPTPEKIIDSPESAKEVIEELRCVVMTLSTVLLSMPLSPGQRGKVRNCVKLINGESIEVKLINSN
ncbi:MAG: hypothetical protein V3T82_07950 [Nitrospinaceae bacterium]